jgi:transcriptional regulator with XRE-family HTH domain
MQRSYVGAVERGERNLSLENLDRLATAFEVTLAHLLHFDRLDGAVEPALLD